MTMSNPLIHQLQEFLVFHSGVFLPGLCKTKCRKISVSQDHCNLRNDGILFSIYPELENMRFVFKMIRSQ